MQKNSVYSLVIKSIFVSVEYLIFTSCRLTEKWGVRIFVGCYNFFVKYALFLLSTVGGHIFWPFCSKSTLLLAFLDVFDKIKNK